MGLDQTVIDAIKARILSVARPRKVIVFGSAARGTMTKDSDIDLLIIEDESRDPRAEMVLIGKALRGIGYPVDVVVTSTALFESSKHLVGGIAYPAHKYGTVIYEAA